MRQFKRGDRVRINKIGQIEDSWILGDNYIDSWDEVLIYNGVDSVGDAMVKRVGYNNTIYTLLEHLDLCTQHTKVGGEII